MNRKPPWVQGPDGQSLEDSTADTLGIPDRKRNAPVGVFDSGVGGLTVAREIMRQIPEERLIYFGDTARLPYGSKSKDTIVRYSRQVVRFLRTKDVKAIVIACNTASAYALETIQAETDIPVIGVINAGARTAVSATRNGRIGVIGTKATIRNNAYGKAIRGVRPEVRVFGNACPLFVPLVENGHFSEKDPIARAAAEYYLTTLKRERIDTLILGCTHYPLLHGLISAFFDYQVTLVDPGRETARAVQTYLTVHGLLNGQTQPGSHRYYMTDSAEDFCEVASVFLSCDIHADAQQVAID